MTADEIFTTGNYFSVVGVIRLDGRDLQEGPVTRKALELYMDWAFGRSESEE
jgi:branched-chain amino acid aminotransferase